MDDVSRLLLKMFSLPLASRGSAAISSQSLALVPIEALVNDILPGVFTSGQIDEIVQLVSKVTTSQEKVADSLHYIHQVSMIVDDQLNAMDREQSGGASRRALDNGRLKTIEQGFDFLLTLNHALTGQSILSIKLQPAHIASFRYVESLRIASKPGEPLIVLVGLLPDSLVQSPVQPDLSGDKCPIIRDTEILYHTNKQIPHLNVKGRFRSSHGELGPLNQSERPQKPFPDGDLDVFSISDRPIGKIATRKIDPSEPISGKYVQLTLPRESDVLVYETRFYDRDENLKARSLRLVE